MKMQWITLGIIIKSIFLSSCATSDDPAKGGFFNGVSGLATGSYQRRVDEKEQQLYNEQATQNDLILRADQLRREREQVRTELDQVNQRLASLDRTLSEQRRRLEQQQHLRADDKARLQRAESDLKAAQNLVLQAEQEDQPIGDARDQVDEIRLRLSRLKDLVAELAGDSG